MKFQKKKQKKMPKPQGPSLALRAMIVLTAVSGTLTLLSWKLMYYLPQAGMKAIAATGADPAITILVSRDAFAIFAGLCAVTLLCVLVGLFVWLRKL